MRVVFSMLALGVASVICANEANIPVLDMRDFTKTETREEFVNVVRDALHEFGFFALTNTGIDVNTIQETFGTVEGFFALPREKKMLIDGRPTNYQRGYIPMYQESAKGEAVGDFKEFLHIGRERDAEHALRVHSWPNLWPDFYDLKTNVAKYRLLLDNYTEQVCHILALALGEEETFFDEGMIDSESLMRIIHYPAPKEGSDNNGIWAAAHTDIDLFAILPQATADGLEVQLADGTWLPVKATEDSMIINGGDFLEIYSNGYFKSAVHRVKSPEGNIAGDRLSMVYFAHPRSEVMLSPCSQWIEEAGGVKKFADATRWEMLMERLADLGLASDEMLRELSDCKLMERLMEYGRESKDALQALKDHGYASEKVLERLAQFDKEDLSRGRCQCCEVTKSENIE